MKIKTSSHKFFSFQLKKKQKDALHVLRKYGSELARVNPGLAKFINFQKMRRKGQVCEVDDIVPSPVIDKYRNKCEFTIGEYLMQILISIMNTITQWASFYG